jgi:hypothetical protein
MWRQRRKPWSGIGDIKNGYLSDDDSDALQDGNPRNLREPTLPAEDNFYNLIGPPAFKHWIQSALMP